MKGGRGPGVWEGAGAGRGDGDARGGPRRRWARRQLSRWGVRAWRREMGVLSAVHPHRGIVTTCLISY